MTTTTQHPPAEAAAARARKILDSIRADHEFPAFRAASLEHSEDWQCFTGLPVISRWNLEADSPALFDKGLRALALKAAVYELTDGDENTAEIPIAVPVDEMTHAMIAQPQLLARITARVGVSIIHQTDQEHTDYTAGDYTHAAHTAA